MVPSSPKAPCSTGKTTSTCESSSLSAPGFDGDEPLAGGIPGEHEPLAVVDGRQFAAADGELGGVAGAEHPAALPGDADRDGLEPLRVEVPQDAARGQAGDGVLAAAPAEHDRHPDLLAHGEPPYPVTSANSPAPCAGRRPGATNATPADPARPLATRGFGFGVPGSVGAWSSALAPWGPAAGAAGALSHTVPGAGSCSRLSALWLSAGGPSAQAWCLVSDRFHALAACCRLTAPSARALLAAQPPAPPRPLRATAPALPGRPCPGTSASRLPAPGYRPRETAPRQGPVVHNTAGLWTTGPAPDDSSASSRVSGRTTPVIKTGTHVITEPEELHVIRTGTHVITAGTRVMEDETRVVEAESRAGRRNQARASQRENPRDRGRNLAVIERRNRP